MITQTKDGKFFAWRYNEFGQLGTGDFFLNRSSPTEIPIVEKITLKNEQIDSFYCFTNHSTIITNNHRCCVWNSNVKKEFGISNFDNLSTPAFIEIQNKRINWIEDGFYHTILITLENELYSYGWNCYGECGVGDRKPRDLFTSIKFSLNPKKIVEHIESVVVNLNQLSFFKSIPNFFTEIEREEKIN